MQLLLQFFPVLRHFKHNLQTLSDESALLCPVMTQKSLPATQKQPSLPASGKGRLSGYSIKILT
jgi:hypothetical protein